MENQPLVNIVLIGFMGSGKSSVGRRIAAMTGRQFVDTDRLVVERVALTIPKIFENFGETYFRDLESETLEAISGERGVVVATGGGIILRSTNVGLLKNIGTVVLLTASEAAIFERVSRRKSRPLLQTEDPKKTISDLLALRRPMYLAAADVVIDTTDLSHDEVARQLLKKIA